MQGRRRAVVGAASRLALAVAGRAIEYGRVAEEIPDEQPHAADKERCAGHQHEEVHLYLQLHVEVAYAQHARKAHLADAGGGKGKRHAEHAGDLQPESPIAYAAAFFWAVARHGG